MRPGMAQEEYNQRCSKSSSGGGCGGGGGGGGGGCGNGCGGGGGNRSSKKLKQKKVPQRGLGVAQLERIRLDEQQKRDAAAVAMQAAAMLSPNSLVSSSNSSCLALQCATNFRHNPSPPSISLPPPSPTDLSSPNSIFRSATSIPNMDVLNPNPVPLSKPSNGGGGGEIGWSAISGLGQGNWPKLWNGDYHLEGENHRLDQHALGIRSNMKLPHESSPIWPPPNLIQRIQQFQQQSSSSSMVTVSSGTSSSSVMNYHQMEPPSNQSFCGKNYTTMWPKEEKMVGMKRPCPFSLGNSSGPPFPCKFPPAYVPPITRTDESASNGVAVNDEPDNPTFSTLFKEGPSISTVMSDELNSKKLTKESRDLNGDFLSLAPPTTALPHPSSKYKHLSVFPQNQEPSEFEPPPPHQGSAEEDHQPEPSGGSTQQPPPPPFYSFFPSAKANTTATSCSGQVGEKLDLNLKL